MNELAGTKELIFDTFIELTSTLGYESVGMRDIAKEIGICAASIYNHFEAKEQILEFAYAYYTKHLYDNRKPAGMIKKLIETASAEDIVGAMTHTFEAEDRKKYVRMILITKIIYMRIFQDPVANAIFTESKKNSVEYVTDILEHGVKIGRLDPAFGKEIFADVLVSSMVIMGVEAFANPDYVAGQLEREPKILALFTQLLSSSLTAGSLGQDGNK